MAVHGRQDTTGTGVQQLFRQCAAELFGFRARAADLSLQQARAIGRTPPRALIELIARQFGIAANRHLTATLQAVVHRPVGHDAISGVGVIEWC